MGDCSRLWRGLSSCRVEVSLNRVPVQSQEDVYYGLQQCCGTRETTSAWEPKGGKILNSSKVYLFLVACVVLFFTVAPASGAILYVSIHGGTITGNADLSRCPGLIIPFSFSGLARVDTSTGTITPYCKTSHNGFADSLALFPTGRYIVYDTNDTAVAALHLYDLNTDTDYLLVNFDALYGSATDPQDLVLEPPGAPGCASSVGCVLVSHYTFNIVTRTNLTLPPYIPPAGSGGGLLPDAATAILKTITRPEGLAYDNLVRLFLLAGFLTGNSGIYQIDPINGTTLNSNIGFDSTNTLDGLTFDPKTGFLYATSKNSGALWRIVPSTLIPTQVGTLPSPASGSGDGPDGLVPDTRGLLYIAERGGSQMAVWSFNAQDCVTNPGNCPTDLALLTPVDGIDDISPLPVLAPVIGKAFGAPNPPGIALGSTTSLTFTITNPNPAIALSGIGFTDDLPLLGLQATATTGSACNGGTYSVPASGLTISLSNGSLAGGGSCSFAVTVTGIAPSASNTPLGWHNVTTAVTSTEGGQGNIAYADLIVLKSSLPPGTQKTFGTSSIPLNGSTTLQLVLSNPNTVDLTGCALTDTLTACLQAPPAAAVTACGGTFTVTAPSIPLPGGTIPAGGTCTLPQVTVKGILASPLPCINTTSTLVCTGVTPGAPGTAQLTVTPPPPTPPVILKTFAAANIALNGTTTVTFTITNPNASALTGITFTDKPPDWPAGLQAPPATGPACGGTYTATATTITLGNGSLAGGASCTITVTVTGLADGSLTNCVTVFTANSTPTIGNTSCASILIGIEAPFQIRYAANLDQGDSVVNITNTGALNGFDPQGRICANVYTFDPNEEQISCCSCLITPNGLGSLSVRTDLIGNALTRGVPTSVVIKLLASAPDNNGHCNASVPTASTLASGMRAWGTTLHALPTFPITYGTAETPFSISELSVSELSKITSTCGFIQSIGSGYGICKSCQSAGQGGTTK